MTMHLRLAVTNAVLFSVINVNIYMFLNKYNF